MSDYQNSDTAKWDADQVRRQTGETQKAAKGKKKRRFGWLIYLACVIVGSCLLAGLGWLAVNDVCALNKAPLTATIEVESGDSVGKVATKLKKAGLIDSKLLFMITSPVFHASRYIQPGVYELNTDMDFNCLIKSMQPTGGVFNQILSFLHLPTSQWYMGQKSALMSLAFITIWQSMGYGVLIVISGLKAIPNHVYEAARLDKASRLKTFTHITLPLLSPTMFFLLVTTSVGAFTTFDIVAMMTNGGPGNSTYMLAYYVYMQGIRFMHYGRAMAASVVLLIITSTLSAINFALAGKKVHYQ